MYPIKDNKIYVHRSKFPQTLYFYTEQGKLICFEDSKELENSTLLSILDEFSLVLAKEYSFSVIPIDSNLTNSEFISEYDFNFGALIELLESKGYRVIDLDFEVY